MQSVFKLFGLLFEEIKKHAIFRQAGALAFFALFALPPLLLFVLLGGRAVFHDDTARDALLEQVEETMGEEGRRTVDSVIEHTPRPGQGDVVGQGFGVFALLFGATAAFHQLQGILNAIWLAPHRRGWWRLLRVVVKRVVTFSAVLVTGILVLVYLVAGSVVAALPEEIAEKLGATLPDAANQFVTGGLQSLLSFLLLGLHFTLVFKFLPDAKVPWKSAVYGATLSAALFVLSKHFLVVYLRYVDLASAFGAASSLVVTLVWFYVAAILTLIGAAFAHAYARWRGLVPAPAAVQKA